MATVAFWAAAVLLAQTYFLYPLWLVLLARVRPGRWRSPVGPQLWPTVSLVVAAHDEVGCIGDKLRNSLALDYPPDQLEVLIGSDGSTDGTDAIVGAYPDPRVQLSAAPRAGKTSVLNRCIPAARGEVVVLSDANTRIDPGALRALVRHFDDPQVGAVCGRLQLYNPTRAEYEESAYWKYESWLKALEGTQGAVVGANGGLYALRRSLFTRLPPSTIVDDFVIPLRLLDQGYHVLYEPGALASEETTEDYGREFGRRARIAAGNFQSLGLVPGLLSPLRGFPAFAFWSHKILRWCAPALLLVVMAANVALLDRPFYRVTLAAQLGFYALAGLGSLGIGPSRLQRIASAAYYFVTMNLALVVGFWRFLRHSQGAAWERTARA
ncbi:MAG TPA: glycosyltransferase family 2 protein [Myxococcaceae bacterium]|nr:glycosyltransferase family 2 protein [Myxococcaceae bacterium]